MLVFSIHWLIEYWGTISRYPRFQLVLANSELKEVYVMPFRENKEACLLSDRFWGGRGWSSVSAASPSCQVGPVGFFTLFSTLPLINTVMPSCIKVRDYFTELHQRITRGLKLVPWPWSIWTVYIAYFMTTYWFVQQPVSAIILDALKEHRENKQEGGNILFALWDGEGHAERENKFTPHFYKQRFLQKLRPEREANPASWVV